MMGRRQNTERSARRKRLLLSVVLAAALFASLSAQPGLAVGPTHVRFADLSPAAIYQSMINGANFLYTRGRQVINNLHLAYRIHARMNVVGTGSKTPAPAIAPEYTPCKATPTLKAQVPRKSA